MTQEQPAEPPKPGTRLEKYWVLERDGALDSVQTLVYNEIKTDLKTKERKREREIE